MKAVPIKRMKKIFDAFSKVKVLVVGDVMLDQYIWGKVTKISPEAPVPVVNVVRESFMPGGSANVVNNVSALGASVYVAGAIGNDAAGVTLKEGLRTEGVNTDGLIVDKDRPTILKTRIIASHQQVVRVDRDGKLFLDNEYMERIIKYVGSIIKKIDAIIIEDYGKGVITQECIDAIVLLAKKHGKVTSVDPKDGHFLDYSGATVVTPNHHEALSCIRRNVTEQNGLDEVGRQLLRKWNCGNILITCGEDGMIIFEGEKEPFKIQTVAREVFDVSGAGDTVIAALTTSLASGATIRESAIISNYAAGIVVGKLGTATTNREEITAAMKTWRS
ncbi:MAG: D-glycero-beta-D-manno-heptose-7-phosphate kinase [Candidatus Ancaeobacter aquaticus]|nr:D-glycero-beta-D-manno-heptose-7-phosphate kinase [Candidatus Ancaeobacter aquaticus]